MTNFESARALYARTPEERFALGAFNVDKQETLAIARAAAAKQSPVLVEASQRNLRAMVDNYEREFRIELYLDLDHSPSVAAAKVAIDAGFELVHIDVSQAKKDATDEEIIAATREVVEYARTTGACMESEPHYFGGSSNVHAESIDYAEIRRTFTTPDGARAFVAATGIDTFAVAIRTLLGTPDGEFRGAVERGISKININTELRRAYRTTLEQQVAARPDEYAIVKLIGLVTDAIQAVIEHRMLTGEERKRTASIREERTRIKTLRADI